jgi:hypothetical protein
VKPGYNRIRMEIKHLVQRFAYRIEPKPEGGFIARSSDPTIAPLEAPTREELQQKIQVSLAAAMAEAFPGLKLPLQDHQTRFEVHIDRKPGGGFQIHSEQQGATLVESATQEKVEHFAEKFLGLVDKNFPQLEQALVAKALSKAGAQVPPKAIPISNGLDGGSKVSDSGMLISSNSAIGDFSGNQPITPEAGSNWKVFRFLLAVLIGVLLYFFFHRV